MVYDEQSKEWKPRFGYKRKVNESDALPPIMDAAPGDDGSENPWEKKERERKDRIGKQKKREKRNEEEIYGKAHLPQDPNASRAETKAAAQAALALAQKSTASVGKFDTKLKGEKAKPMKRKLDGEAALGKGEKARNLELLNKIVSLDSAVLDVGKAAGRVSFVPDSEKASKKHKGGGKGAKGAKGGKGAKGAKGK